jgi:hypothetical protein
MIFAGALGIYMGYQMLLFSLIYPDFIFSIVGTIMPVYGLLAFCMSLTIWLQKSWSTKIIAILGVVVCGALIIFGAYLAAIVIFAPLHWIAIRWIRNSQPIETPDWAPDWNED